MLKLKTLTRQQVEMLADSSLIFQRGLAYLSGGAVTGFQIWPDGISASVAGSGGNSYQVEISEVDGDLELDCTCPYEGEVCKHAVAVLLYYLNQARGSNSSTLSPNQVEVATTSGLNTVLGRVLSEMEHSTLVALLLRLSEPFRRTLLENVTIPAQVVQQQPLSPAHLRHLKNEITRYFNKLPQTLDEYYESEELDEIDDFLVQIGTFNPHDQLDLLMHLVEAGNAILDEYAINTAQLGEALSYYGQAASLLVLSAKDKQPHFERLLGTLEDLNIWDYGADLKALKAGLDALASAKEDYLYLLKRFEELEDYPEVTDWIADYYLKLGDDENYLAVRQANLQTEAYYLELADYWHSKGQVAKYLETLESWLVRLAENRAPHLAGSGYAVGALLENGIILQRLAEYYEAQHDDENWLRVLLLQATYRTPKLGLYQSVKQVAARLKRWEEVRSQFLGLINPYNQRVLAEIYLYEKDWQAAIDLAQQTTGYGQEDIKGLVAGEVQQHRPEAAIELYQALVDFNIERANRKYYQYAARYAARIKEVYVKILKDAPGWQRYIRQVRSTNSRRPALLDEFKAL